MSTDGAFRMPSLGADMDEGRLIEWLVKPGDRVKRGDLIAVVATSKANLEVEVWEDGVVQELCVQPDTVVPVGAVLARLAPAGGPAPAAPAAAPAPPAATRPAPEPEPATPAPAATVPVVPPAAAGRVVPAHELVRASPHARRRARELGVDLRDVVGTGPGGTVRSEDIEQAARGAPAAGAADRLRGVREGMARAMARSKREIPHYYLTADVDMTPALAWLERENLSRGLAERILPAALLLRAIATSVRDVPEVNGFFVEGALRPSAGVHLGVGISLRGGGLIAPALLDVDDKPLATVMAELRDLVDRARLGRLRGREVSDPTLTVTNLGDQGVSSVLGVIYPPQVALVGVGRIEQRPRVVGGAVVPRSVVTLSLSGDHRASDGHRGGRFLAAISKRLARPEDL